MEVGCNATPRPLYPQERPGYPQYGRLGGPQGRSGWAREISPPTGIRSPDRPARNKSLYRLSYRGPFTGQIISLFIFMRLEAVMETRVLYTGVTYGCTYKECYVTRCTLNPVALQPYRALADRAAAAGRRI